MEHGERKIHTYDEILSDRGAVFLGRVARTAEERLAIVPGVRDVLGNARGGCHILSDYGAMRRCGF